MGSCERSYVIVNKTVGKKDQAEPGRQEWITVIECIGAEGTLISPYIIFTGMNIVINWLPKIVPKGWKFSCNASGWTNNFHGVQWLKTLFDPETKAKANGRKRLLICDGHDSHISPEFVRYCMNNGIEQALLIPHSSHMMQPLDVGVFGPLKKAMSKELNVIFRTGISRIQKPEWVEFYDKARRRGITTENILAGWRGAGLFPLNKHRIICQIQPDHQVTPSPFQALPQTPMLLTSSPPDTMSLHSSNSNLNSTIAKLNLQTPIKTHIRRLSGIAEQLHADNLILQKQLSELQTVITNRTERKTGKRIILKGVTVITSQDICQALEKAEAATKSKTKGRKRSRARTETNIAEEESYYEEMEIDEEDGVQTLESQEHQLLDCIEVQM